MNYEGVYNKQALAFLKHKQSPRSTCPPHHISTFRKLESYIIDRYIESAAGPSPPKDTQDEMRQKAIEKLRDLDYRKFTVYRYSDGTIASIEPVHYLFIESFLEDRLKRGESNLTFNTMRKHLIQFFDWIGLDPNPAAAVMRAAREPRKKPVPLTTTEIDSLLNAASDSLADLALLYIMLRCGPRASEITGIKPHDYDRSRRILFIAPDIRKGHHAHHVPVPPDAAAVLEAYLDAPRSNKLKYMFPGKNGQKMTYGELVSTLDRLARKAGIRRFSPHLLRHTAATLLATGGSGNEGMDLVCIARILGHKSPTITETYIHIPLDELMLTLQRSTIVTLVERELRPRKEERDVEVTAVRM